MKKTKRLLWMSVVLALVMLMGLGCNTAQKTAAVPEADKSWMFHDIVDVKFVQQYAKMPQPANVMLIDSRPNTGKCDKGSIPTAISIPDSEFAKMTDKLPKDKNSLLIFFCQGPT